MSLAEYSIIRGLKKNIKDKVDNIFNNTILQSLRGTLKILGKILGFTRFPISFISIFSNFPFFKSCCTEI